MTKITRDHILAALPTLTHPDLEAIQAVCASLTNGRTGAIDRPANTLAAPLIEALGGAVNATVPLANLLGTTTGKTFEKHLPAVAKFLDAHFKGWNVNKVTETAFLRMLMELLRDDLKERGVTPSLGIMVTNLLRLPEVVENAYPGYMAAGLGDMVLRHFAKVRLPSKTPMARKRTRRI